jgi:hypothetical protein
MRLGRIWNAACYAVWRVPSRCAKRPICFASSATGRPRWSRSASLVDALADVRSRRAGDGEDDVPDPISRPVEAHEEAGELIVGALLPLLGRVAALATADDPSDDIAGLAPRP